MKHLYLCDGCGNEIVEANVDDYWCGKCRVLMRRLDGMEIDGLPGVTVTEAKVLRLQPGDVLHVKVPKLTDESRERLHHYLTDRLPEGTRFVIGCPGMELDVIRQDGGTEYDATPEGGFVVFGTSPLASALEHLKTWQYTLEEIAKRYNIPALGAAFPANRTAAESPCPDCKGSRTYQPLNGPAEPCRTCCG